MVQSEGQNIGKRSVNLINLSEYMGVAPRDLGILF